jgi:hypothetical protein
LKVLLETAGVYKLLGNNQVYKNWKEKTFETIPKDAMLIGAWCSISSFPKMHAQLFLVDGEPPADMTEVVYDKKNLDNIFGHVNCGDSGSANAFIPLVGYQVRQQLKLAVWAHNMNWGAKDFHAEYTVIYSTET